MSWKNLPHWLKGGIIGAIVWLLYIVYMIYKYTADGGSYSFEYFIGVPRWPFARNPDGWGGLQLGMLVPLVFIGLIIGILWGFFTKKQVSFWAKLILVQIIIYILLLNYSVLCFLTGFGRATASCRSLPWGEHVSYITRGFGNSLIYSLYGIIFIISLVGFLIDWIIKKISPRK